MASPPPAPRLENRLVPDDAHGRPEHPLRELAWLLGSVLLTLVLVIVLVGWAAQWLAPRVPFAVEVALADRLMPEPVPGSPADTPQRRALQALTLRVVGAMALPDGMVVQAAVDPSKAVNAYATVGGRIRVFQGLLAQVGSEEELAALLAHEIAHVQLRHVAANLGRGLTLSLLLSVVSSDAGAAVAQALLGQATHLALLGYSREQERQADAAALRASVALYGHGAGLVSLLQRLAAVEQQRRSDGGPEILRSHPHTADRLAAVQALAQQQGWPLTAALQPLPPALRMAAATRPAP